MFVSLVASLFAFVCVCGCACVCVCLYECLGVGLFLFVCVYEPASVEEKEFCLRVGNQ